MCWTCCQEDNLLAPRRGETLLPTEIGLGFYPEWDLPWHLIFCSGSVVASAIHCILQC